MIRSICMRASTSPVCKRPRRAHLSQSQISGWITIIESDKALWLDTLDKGDCLFVAKTSISLRVIHPEKLDWAIVCAEFFQLCFFYLSILLVRPCPVALREIKG